VTRAFCAPAVPVAEEEEKIGSKFAISSLCSAHLLGLIRAYLLWLQELLLGIKQKPTCQLFLGGGSETFQLEFKSLDT
jgi:hypothetical protein